MEMTKEAIMEPMQTAEQEQVTTQEEQTMEQEQVTTQEQAVTQEVHEVSSEDMETTSNTNEKIVMTEHYAELLERNGYVLNMHIVSNVKSRRSKGCKFYLTRKGSNIPLLTGEEEISISCRKLLQATDYRVMDIIRDLDIGFIEDDLKKAFKNAKDCVTSTQARMDESNSLRIDEAYSVLMQDAVAMAEEEKLQQMAQEQQSEQESTIEKVKTRALKYDKEHQMIMISKTRFRQMLEDLDCGFTATTFCKKLAILETHMGISILQRNSGRCGYDYATADMGRVYKFKIVDLQQFACE